MPIAIGNYVQSSFVFDKWIISDEYEPNKSGELTHGNKYRIVVSSLNEVKDHMDLSVLAIQTSFFVEKLTMLIKYVLFFKFSS